MSTNLTPGAAGNGNRDYLLHLYDALWENMRSKENRLWTFLSLYGAAVGLVFAGGQVSQIPGADLFAVVIVMGLTTWAVLIILNTNWWYYRNQLMVSRIEIKYPDAVKGVVPKIYNENPNYRFDQLSENSILLLSLLLFFLYSRTIWSYHAPGSIDTLQSLVVVVLLYVLFNVSAIHCLRLHESNLEAYYGAKKAILEDESVTSLTSDQRVKLLTDQTKARRELDPRLRILLMLVLVAALFDVIVVRNGISSSSLLAVISFQAVAALLFLAQRYFYRQSDIEDDSNGAVELNKNAICDTQRDELNRVLNTLEDKMSMRRTKDKSRKFWYGSWHIMLLVLASAAITIPGLYRSNQKVRQDWIGQVPISANDVGSQINKLQQELQNVQKSFNEMQQSNVQLQKQLLDERLIPYTKRQEADQRFVTREEFNKMLESKSQKGKN